MAGFSTSFYKEEFMGSVDNDSFGQELKYAAFADGEAWRARKKSDEARLGTTLFPSIRTAATEPLQEAPSSDTQARSGSTLTLSFPYGDEQDILFLSAESSDPNTAKSKAPKPSRGESECPLAQLCPPSKALPPAELSQSGLAAWVTTGLPFPSASKDKASFQPYGNDDAEAEASSPRSPPCRDNSENLQSGDRANSLGVRMGLSPGVPTTLHEFDENKPRMNAVEDFAARYNEPEKLTSTDMMREVAELSAYVKRYEARKEKQKSRLAALATQIASQMTLERNSSCPSRPFRNRGDQSDGESSAPTDPLSNSSDMSMSESEDSFSDEPSGRIGITRYGATQNSPQRPFLSETQKQASSVLRRPIAMGETDKASSPTRRFFVGSPPKPSPPRRAWSSTSPQKSTGGIPTLSTKSPRSPSRSKENWRKGLRPPSNPSSPVESLRAPGRPNRSPGLRALRSTQNMLDQDAGAPAEVDETGYFKIRGTSGRGSVGALGRSNQGV